MDEGGKMHGKVVGDHNKITDPSGFWQINVGHVLTMGTIIMTLLKFSSDTVSEFSSLRQQITDQKEAISDVKSAIGDMRSWREQQNAESMEFHNQTSAQFDGINRHLERLDWSIGQLGYKPPSSAPDTFMHRRK